MELDDRELHGVHDDQGGEDLIHKFEEQVRGFHVHLELDSVEAIHREDDGFVVRTASENTFRCRAVVLAPGKEPRTLGLPGEDRLMGRGVSICATCDAPLFHDRPVAVVGGGNAAIRTAIEMTKIASSVAMIVRSDLRCDEVYIARAKEVGVRIYLRHEVTALHGEDSLTGITIRDRNTGGRRSSMSPGSSSRSGSCRIRGSSGTWWR